MTDQSQLPHPTRRNWVWFILQWMLLVVAIPMWGVKIRGREKLPAGGALLLLNHQSFLDPIIFAMTLRRPVSFLARDSLFKVPIVGWILRRTYVMPISREAASTASIREAARRMQHGLLVGIFPEGTRTADGNVNEFKPGFVALVRRGQVPVVPIGIAGTFQAYSRKAMIPRPGPRICMVVGDPIVGDELEQLTKRGEEETLAAVAHERVSACHREAEEWRARRWFGPRKKSTA
ncbi:MAG: lysophospholipid acyltransferase family protein [Planctomycetota bacterium]|nr:lysophospholipid acyltransferase family protein [Planctomycetota bacterium]